MTLPPRLVSLWVVLRFAFVACGQRRLVRVGLLRPTLAGRCIWRAAGLASRPVLRTRAVATANRACALPPKPTTSSSKRVVQEASRGIQRSPHPPLTGRWWRARAQAPIRGCHKRRCASPALTKRGLRTDESARERGPENAHDATGLVRGATSETRGREGLRPKETDEARRCTAPHPAPAPPTVPRETPTPKQAAQRSRPPGVCPSSPSTPLRASRPMKTRS